MTRKEKIIEILDKYWIRRGWIESDESMVEARPLTAKEELADAILSLPIDVPSDKEIKEESLCGHINLHDHNWMNWYNDDEQEVFITGAKWAINEILKRNKTE